MCPFKEMYKMHLLLDLYSMPCFIFMTFVVKYTNARLKILRKADKKKINVANTDSAEMSVAVLFIIITLL